MALMNLIESAVKKGVIIAIKTQCHHGPVSDVYETGRKLTRMGCIMTMDMTVEATFAKLSYLLGKGFSRRKILQMMRTNLRGELTDQSRVKETYSLANNKMVMAIAEFLKVNDYDDIKEINQTITPVLVNSVVSQGNLALLKKLKNEGADLNNVDYLGRSALHVVSSTTGNLEIVGFLVT